MAAGTLYGAIENLQKKEFISSIPSTDARRKIYVISEKSKQILYADCQRMKHMLSATNMVFEQEASENETHFDY